MQIVSWAVMGGGKYNWIPVKKARLLKTKRIYF
jgi:hypothetical protein